MLKDVIDLWKKRGIMIKAVDLFGEMLDDTYYVFHESWRVFTGEIAVDAEKDKIYGRDKSVNMKERAIRKLLMENLTINPGNDASGCLALMSMVKDAERVGDYSKNILDLVVLLDKVPSLGKFSDTIHAVVNDIDASLKSLRDAFVNSDEEIVKAIIARYEKVKKESKQILHEIFENNISKEEALIVILVSRYLKRINSHITNVASGIILPLDQIDFVRGGLLEN